MEESLKPTLHLIGIFHTCSTQEYSHCAFTGKALRFPKMLQDQGYKVIEYSNGLSESAAATKVQLLSAAELANLTSADSRRKENFHGDLATLGTSWHQEFERRLLEEMKLRVKERDIICHPFGHAHSRIVSEFPKNIHVETGIGYPTTMPGTIKIFESYGWRHFHCGKDGRQGTHYEYVIPNYFEIADWQPRYLHGDYIAFLGRIDACKGLDTIFEIAKRVDRKIVLHGQGDHTKWQHPNIEYRGPIHGTARSEFMRNAYCSLMPTNFIEPFGGSGVEGLLCGTPLIATDYGAFTETVQPGVNGYRCKTLQDWLEAIDNVELYLDREAIATAARATYSLEACGLRYAKAFSQIYELYDNGWYTLSDKYQDREAELAARFKS